MYSGTYPQRNSTEDWSIGESGGATPASVQANLKKWLTGPKSPGLITLEHELTKDTVNAFMTAFPMIQSNGWKLVSVAELDGGSAYQNANGDEGTVTPINGILVNGAQPPPPSSTPGASSSPGSPTSSMHSTIAPSTSSTATNSIVTSAGSSSVNGTSPAGGVPGGQGSKQANVTSSGAPSPSGSSGSQQQQQQNGASSFVQMAIMDVRGLAAAFLTAFVVALA